MPSQAFRPASRQELQEAVDLWCQDRAAAVRWYGAAIGAWDVSGITNMAGLFAGKEAFGATPEDDISAWNTASVTTMAGMFEGCTAFNQALASWDIACVTDMRGMFAGATSFRQSLTCWRQHPAFAAQDTGYVAPRFRPRSKRRLKDALAEWCDDRASALERHGDIGTWDVSCITDMSSLFAFRASFNDDISAWDVSSVTNMREMFYCCTAFNQPLASWNVSRVRNMAGMFYGCAAFNQSLAAWDVSSVEDMAHMFDGCAAFNQPLASWDVLRVRDMADMFSECTAFNRPLASWDVSSVRDMSEMFYGCAAFNQPLQAWNVSAVEDMARMFHGCAAFNQPLQAWDVSSVANMQGMFYECIAFNQHLQTWDVSSVTDMSVMFRGCVAFNQPLAPWDVSSVTNMGEMFRDACAFNQPLASWNVSSVDFALDMFRGAGAFQQSLDTWPPGIVNRTGINGHVAAMMAQSPSAPSPANVLLPGQRHAAFHSRAKPLEATAAQVQRLPLPLRQLAEVFHCPLTLGIVPRCPVYLRRADGTLSNHVYEASEVAAWQAAAAEAAGPSQPSAAPKLLDPVTRAPLDVGHASGIMVQPLPLWQTYSILADALDVASGVASSVDPAAQPRKRQRIHVVPGADWDGDEM